MRSRLNLRSRASKKDKAIIINDHLWMLLLLFLFSHTFCNLEILGSFSSTAKIFRGLGDFNAWKSTFLLFYKKTKELIHDDWKFENE